MTRCDWWSSTLPRNGHTRASLGINEDNAQTVRNIYQWFIDGGLTLRGIATRLQDEGILTATKSDRWYPSVVRKIVSNSANKGELLYQRTERVKGEHGRRTKTKLRPESEWITIPVPRIVTDIIWDRAQMKLQENKALSKRNVKRNYLLPGLIHCPECGSKLAGKARYEKRFYRCNNVDKIVGSRVCTGTYIPANQVEKAVWAAVSDSLKNPELLADQYRKQSADSSVADDFELNKKQVALALKRVLVQEDRMTDAYRNEAIDLDRYKSKMNQLSLRRKALQTQQEESIRNQAQQDSRKSALEHLERFCGEVANGLDALTFEEQQNLLRLVVKRTFVKDHRVRIETVIPTNKQHVGLLNTRHPELDSGSVEIASYGITIENLLRLHTDEPEWESLYRRHERFVQTTFAASFRARLGVHIKVQGWQAALV